MKAIMERIRRRAGLLRRLTRITALGLAILAVLWSSLYVIRIPRYTEPAGGGQEGVYRHEDNIDRLEFNDDASFRVVMKSGYVWDSNPSAEMAEKDSVAKGINRMAMRSQLMIRYADSGNKITELTSFVSAFDKGREKPQIRREGSKYIIPYRFAIGKKEENQFILIPLVYEIEGGGLKVWVDLENIEETGEYRLVSISLLPFFGAGSPTEAGYIMVPDGSGALIGFNSLTSAGTEYTSDIYGRDNSLKTQKITQVNPQVRLPVFGVKKDGNAFLAVIDKGEAQASVTAKANGVDTSWNNAFFTFRYRETDTITLNEMSWESRSIPFLSKMHSSEKSFCVRYYFLEGGDADYTGMAAANRAYLKSVYQLEPLSGQAGVPMYLEANMSVRRVKPVLGLPVETVEPLTTFEELSQMLDSFKKAGIDSFVVKMNGWYEGGPYGGMPTGAQAENAIGGDKGFEELLTRIGRQKDTLLFPSVDFTQAYRSGNGFIPLLQGVRDVSGAMALQYKYLQSTGVKDLRTAPWHLVNPRYSAARLQSFMKSYEKLIDDPSGVGIAVDGYGSLLYSDTYESFLDPVSGRVPADRAETMRLWQNSLAGYKSPVMVAGGNSYMLGSAQYIVNIPMTDSSHRLFTRSIPYYQIVMSGIVHTASTPVNFSEDTGTFLLHCLETGTFPMYSFIARESSLVKQTRLDYVYNGQYSLWLDEAAAAYRQYYDAYKKIAGKAITGHEISGSRVAVTFEGGIALEIDYDAKTYRVTGGEGA